MATKRHAVKRGKGSKKLNRAKKMRAVKPLTEPVKYLTVGMDNVLISG